MHDNVSQGALPANPSASPNLPRLHTTTATGSAKSPGAVIVDDARNTLDRESEGFLALLTEQEKARGNRVPGVRTVLVVLSAAGMVYDTEALRHYTLLAYPDSAVFFRTTRGKAIGAPAPAHVDLLVDLTGPRQRQSMLYARRLRRLARFAVGRDAGLFRRRIYDRVFDEKKASLPAGPLEHERKVQLEVLALAGVAFKQAGGTLPDLGQSIALGLPPMAKL